jgi:hypothetical protein
VHATGAAVVRMAGTIGPERPEKKPSGVVEKALAVV